MNLTIILNLFFLSIFFFLTNCAKFKKILLKDVQAITLKKGEYTLGNKIIPQLKCLNNKNLCAYGPEVVQCVNQGYDGIDVQWKCNGDLSKKVKFKKLKVNCEGYNYPNDPYVIAGSCGLEYLLTEVENNNSNNNTDFGFLWILIIFGVFCYLFMICKRSNSENNRNFFRQVPTAPPQPGFKDEYTSERQNNYYSERKNSGSKFPNLFYLLGSGGLGYLLGRNQSSSFSQRPFTDYQTYNYNKRYSKDDTSEVKKFYDDDVREAEGFADTKRR